MQSQSFDGLVDIIICDARRFDFKFKFDAFMSPAELLGRLRVFQRSRLLVGSRNKWGAETAK